MVIAISQALDYKSTWRAVGVCIIGWIVQTVIFASFFSVGRGFRSFTGIIQNNTSDGGFIRGTNYN